MAPTLTENCGGVGAGIATSKNAAINAAEGPDILTISPLESLTARKTLPGCDHGATVR